MSWFDRSPEQRDVSDAPRFIGRPARPEPPVPEDPGTGRALRRYTSAESKAHSEALWAWRHTWEVFYDGEPRGGFAELLRKGWEIRNIWPPSRALTPTPLDGDYEKHRDQKRREHRDQVDAWADSFIAGSGEMPFYPSDREDMLAEVARRLREATRDGFLLRSLESA